VLDALEQRRINIKGLALEAPAHPEGFDTFDVEKDIITHDWSIVSDYLTNRRRSQIDRHYFKLASFIKVISPEKYKDSTQEKGEMLWDEMKWILMRQYFETQEPPKTAPIVLDDLTERMYQARILFPEETETFYQENVERWRPKYSILAEHSRDSLQAILPVKWGMFAVAFKGLEELPFKDSDADPFVNEFLKDHRPRRWHESVVSEPMQMAGFLAGLRIALPQRFGEVKLTQDDWEYMRLEIDVLRSKDNFKKGFGAHPQNFAEHAYHLYILAAKDVQVTDQGLQVIPATRQIMLPQNADPLPTKRRF